MLAPFDQHSGIDSRGFDAWCVDVDVTLWDKLDGMVDDTNTS